MIVARPAKPVRLIKRVSRMVKFRSIAAVVTATILIASGSITQAAVVSFGSFSGDSLTYNNVREVNSESAPGFSFFGGVGITGDTLELDADNFREESFGMIVADDARLSFSVLADPGRLISSITISEGGRATTLGAGSFVSATLLGFASVNGVTLPGQSTSFFQSSTGANPVDPDFLIDGTWQRSLTFNFAPTNRARITIDNGLIARAADNGYAFIDKKFVDINPVLSTVTAVPEPGSIAVLAGLGTLVGTRRRRRRLSGPC